MRFDEEINRHGTYCTQWDYVADRFGTSDLLPFTISDTDFAVPKEMTHTLQDRLSHGVFGYTRWNHADFKGSVATWFDKRFDVIIEQDDIVYTPSVMYGISKLIELLSNEGDGVVIQTPAYDAFFKIIAGTNRTMVENPLVYENHYYHLDFKQLEQQLAQEENKILLLCSPHNPSGRVWTRDELTDIVTLCEKHDVFIISDEIHMDVLRQGKRHLSMMSFSYEKIAVVTSGTKTFNYPGLIFSYMMVRDDELKEQFLAVLKGRDGLSSPSIMGLDATMTAYQECEYWVDELNAYLDDNYQLVCEYLGAYLPKIKASQSEGTYLMWLDTSELSIPMAEIQERLINIGKVAIMDGSVYGGNGQQFLRLNIGCPQRKLKEGLERMKQALEAVSQN